MKGKKFTPYTARVHFRGKRCEYLNYLTRSEVSVWVERERRRMNSSNLNKAICHRLSRAGRGYRSFPSVYENFPAYMSSQQFRLQIDILRFNCYSYMHSFFQHVGSSRTFCFLCPRVQQRSRCIGSFAVMKLTPNYMSSSENNLKVFVVLQKPDSTLRSSDILERLKSRMIDEANKIKFGGIEPLKFRKTATTLLSCLSVTLCYSKGS